MTPVQRYRFGEASAALNISMLSMLSKLDDHRSASATFLAPADHFDINPGRRNVHASEQPK